MTDPTPPPIDLAGFRAMMRDAGIEDAVAETLAIYAREAPVVFSRLRASVDDGALDRAASAAHALKSSSSNVWANGLAERLHDIEHAARSGDVSRVSALFAEAEPVFDAVMAQVRTAGA